MEGEAGTLPPPILTSGTLARQHPVALSSVEDDALGEDLQVIWELEPGATTIEKTPLPEPVGFDSPQRLDTFLNAVRWGAALSQARDHGSSGRLYPIGARHAPVTARV